MILGVAGDIPEIKVCAWAEIILVELKNISFRKVRQQISAISAPYFGGVVDRLACECLEGLWKVILRDLSVSRLIIAIRLVVRIHLAESADSQGVSAKLPGQIVARRADELLDKESCPVVLIESDREAVITVIIHLGYDRRVVFVETAVGISRSRLGGSVRPVIEIQFEIRGRPVELICK